MATEQESSAAARQAGRELRQLRSNMPSFVELAIFVVLFAVSLGPAIYLGQTSVGWGLFVGVAGAIIAALAAASIKVANQWERGLVLRLGQFQSIRGPGLFFVAPIIDRVPNHLGKHHKAALDVMLE